MRGSALRPIPRNSAIIGNGFQGFVHLFAKPAEGRTTRPMAQLFNVDPNGARRLVV